MDSNDVDVWIAAKQPLTQYSLVKHFFLLSASRQLLPYGNVKSEQVGEPQGRTGFSAPSLPDAARWQKPLVEKAVR
ncbi:MAG: hypothetical protein V7L29_02150 [Nostoc sp.]|uniref:hypothetical protein n=1 Tax=Nostoc sp. TaxID=1180 RepID=UPI002FF5D50D